MSTLDYFESVNQQLLDEYRVNCEDKQTQIEKNPKFIPFHLAPNAIVALSKSFPSIEYYKYIGTVFYPTNIQDLVKDIVSTGEYTIIDIKIHSNLIGKDFKPLKQGDMAFVVTYKDSNVQEDEIMTLDVPFIVPDSIRDSLTRLHSMKGPFAGPLNIDNTVFYPVFINEPAYQSSNIAFSVFGVNQKIVY